MKTALEILNSAPEGTQPQNSRNDIAEGTPHGLDRYIKERMKADLSTANIISDVLAKAGIAEIIEVANKSTAGW